MDSEVEGTGLAWDRKFAWAELLKPQTRLNASEEEKKSVWTFRTQRAPGYEKLALVKPEVWISELDAKRDNSPGEGKGAVLIIKYPLCPFWLFSTTRQTCNILGPFAIREVF